MVKNKLITSIDLVGGLLCLDFVNSVPNRVENPHPDHLSNIHLLIDWSEYSEIIDRAKANRFHTKANTNLKESEFFFKEAIDFRELLHSIFWHISANKKVPKGDMTSLNKKMKEYFNYLQIYQNSDGFKETWNIQEDDFKLILAPIVQDGYKALLGLKYERIKECPNCGWLFYDTTKNGRRRWCSMKTCGSSIKSLKWYYKNKQNLKDLLDDEKS